MKKLEKHKKVVEKYNGTINELADDISNLNYEVLECFLKRLSGKIFLDSMKDSEGGRHKLANALNKASIDIGNANKRIGEAWKISEPYM